MFTSLTDKKSWQHLRASLCNRHDSSDARGQAIVEFALSFSIFLMLFIGFLGLSLVLFGMLTANNAAREGTHYIVSKPAAADSEVITMVCNTSFGLAGGTPTCQNDLDIMTTAVQCPPTGNPTHDLLMWIEPAVGSRVSGGQVAVTVCYRVNVPVLAFSFLGGGNMTVLGPVWVRGRSVMRIE